MTKDQFLKDYTYSASKNRIGGGSFGTVFKAYDRIKDRDVAIKVQKVDYKNGKELSLMVEYDAIKALDAHPNIANYEKVYRFEDSSGIIDYAVMQFYKSGNLSNFLKTEQTSKEQKDKILVQILQGIAYLHLHKVVHRDIKPSNILVVERPGEGIIPKITDFGLSKRAEVDSELLKFKNSFAGGTIEYCSPEQLRGSDIKFNTDLWSFGVIIFEVFTGKTVFDVDDFEEGSMGRQGKITEMIFKKNIDSEFKKLPNEWQTIARQCLQRDQELRPATGKELLKQFPSSLYNPEEDYFLQTKNAVHTEDDSPTILTQGYPEDDDKTTIISNVGLEEQRLEASLIDKTPTVDTPVKNKKTLLLVLVFLVLVSAIYGGYQLLTNDQPTYGAMAVQNGKTGFIDLDGNFFIENKFDGGSSFGNGMAAVETNTGWNYINPNGEVVINGDFTIATPFSENLALVLKNNAWFYIDQNGQNNLNRTFDDANVFKDGLAPVKTDKGWQFINNKGELAFDAVFDFAFYYSNGLAPVQKNGKWGFINLEGDQVIDFKYSATRDFEEGAIAVMESENQWIFIDNTGNSLFSDFFDGAKNYSENLAGVSKNGAWGFIDKSGDVTIDYQYQNVGEFSNGLAPVKLNEKWGFIDTSGNIVIEPKYNSADQFYKID